PSPEAAVDAILAASPESSVNIRSYAPESPKSHEFLYGQQGSDKIMAHLRRLSANGLSTIVNETIDVNDGGVSGVAFGEVIEFAPGGTPRIVEEPDAACLPRELGLRLLRTVYGFDPVLPRPREARVEFSLHPLRRGVRHEHVAVWEIEEPGPPPAAGPEIVWPNRFSRHLGDKAFGLLVADALGLPVPRTQVIPRACAPFSFGRDTGLAETWIRTCPREQVPGFFTTRHGWLDPFRLLQQEDPEGASISSILAQQGVDARFSGALVSRPGGEPLIEGVSGQGDRFMSGRRPPEALPVEVERAVRDLHQSAAGLLGPVRFEWVFDGETAWVLQLHRGGSASSGRVVVPGEASRYHVFAVAEGIEALRSLIGRVQGTGEGIVLAGRVGVTSHLGDLLRRARIPSRIEDTP
ncbi:MAG TPA: hypothetical protein VE078_09540, partial [Thermoanaerobaculia bacterium]|nr:hypothetical protein [Thermoanaerobaculia bacterium]